ncbi:uncharacterized protein N0V89_007704 [Didymosphaeria variabile]|uniref:Uncharacterized protein n=1 Tax=Didymosphaeria variabile TaxID=1932322 RepID=A0A9W8XLC8_9PLEO|nr:uncharacterized protein N0V89_007704 [Didymosphaeria variabile]KAJ4352356.1 hypothetical protein N0V89_007704 [Didymosphaeria variabile]
MSFNRFSHFARFAPEHTTFSELQECALDKVNSAYKALPHHLLLRFEPIDQETLASFPQKADIATSRLVLGLSRHEYKSAYKPVYAYISKKNQAHQVLLRFGTKHLKPKDFEGVEWEPPFDTTYDAYGQSERAGDKISTLAAYYFLAAGHISKISTRTGGFLQNFIKLCDKIHVPSPTQVGFPGTAAQIDAPRTLPHERHVLPCDMTDGENCATDLLIPEHLLIPELQQESDLKSQPTEEGIQDRQETSDLKFGTVNYQIDNKGGPSTMCPIGDHTSRMSSPTIWDGSDGLAVRQAPSTHSAPSPEDARADREKPAPELQKPVEASLPISSDSKVPNIDDLAAFVHQFKELKAENILLQQHKAEARDLQAHVDRSKQDAKQAYTQAHDLQEKCLDNEEEVKKLRKQLAESLAQSAAKSKKLTYELGQEQWKAQLAQRARDTTQTQLKAVQVEKDDLEQRLAKAEQDVASSEKLAAMESKLEALEGEKQGMKIRIAYLDGEVRKERNKFNDYKKKIRNLSMDP